MCIRGGYPPLIIPIIFYKIFFDKKGGILMTCCRLIIPNDFIDYAPVAAPPTSRLRIGNPLDTRDYGAVPHIPLCDAQKSPSTAFCARCTVRTPPRSKEFSDSEKLRNDCGAAFYAGMGRIAPCRRPVTWGRITSLSSRRTRREGSRGLPRWPESRAVATHRFGGMRRHRRIILINSYNGLSRLLSLDFLTYSLIRQKRKILFKRREVVL